MIKMLVTDNIHKLLKLIEYLHESLNYFKYSKMLQSKQFQKTTIIKIFYDNLKLISTLKKKN